MMKIGLSTASLYLYPLRYTFRLARELGFSGLELAMGTEVRWRGVQDLVAEWEKEREAAPSLTNDLAATTPFR